MDEWRWQRVLARDPHEESFVYAVTTTGVFCRSGCPARRPRRDHVVFFDDADSARVAGYRACRRCRPESSRDDELERLVAACRAQLFAGGTLTVAQMAERAVTSLRQLNRDFRRALGTTPRDFATAVRVRRAREALRASSRVADAIYDAGFGSSRGFYESVSPTLGMSARTFLAGARGEEIIFAVVPTSIAPALVAASTRGVCAVQLGVSEADARSTLRAHFPHARLRQADEELAGAADAIRELADGVPAGEDLPLDVTGTAFQARVWSALRRIPSGETRTYAQVATELGAPGAARAVGRACATNRLALLVPCHRVVRGDGGYGGYRWGAELKSTLLTHEAHSDEAATLHST